MKWEKEDGRGRQRKGEMCEMRRETADGREGEPSCLGDI